VQRFEEGLKAGTLVSSGQPLARMYSVQMQLDLIRLASEIRSAQDSMETLNTQLNRPGITHVEKQKLQFELLRQRGIYQAKSSERDLIRERTQILDDAQPGYFILNAPPFPARGSYAQQPHWTILTADFRDQFTNRLIKPDTPILRLGYKEGPWEIQIKIPQKHVGQILQAFASGDPHSELAVDILLTTMPSRKFKGKLSRADMAGEAVTNRDDPNDAEPVVIASVRIEGDDLDPEEAVPDDVRTSDIEAHVKVRCGRHALGYSLFYGLWEFFYEKVIFPFF